jgi:hypothetical protein
MSEQPGQFSRKWGFEAKILEYYGILKAQGAVMRAKRFIVYPDAQKQINALYFPKLASKACIRDVSKRGWSESIARTS